MDPVLTEIVTKLVANFSPRMIYLFGSRVQGTAMMSSDYDILVVMDELDEAGYRYAQRAHEVLWGLKCSKDIFFTSMERFEELKSAVGSLSELVHRDGRQVYAAAA